jgi:hypothetical protein
MRLHLPAATARAVPVHGEARTSSNGLKEYHPGGPSDDLFWFTPRRDLNAYIQHIVSEHDSPSKTGEGVGVREENQVFLCVLNLNIGSAIVDWIFLLYSISDQRD